MAVLLVCSYGCIKLLIPLIFFKNETLTAQAKILRQLQLFGASM